MHNVVVWWYFHVLVKVAPPYVIPPSTVSASRGNTTLLCLFVDRYFLRI